ncbi:MAG: hypothetical protein IIT36_00050 [Aeriscardovia sp.]|nr:hypothetical protein [Aeriscardovia sp.]
MNNEEIIDFEDSRSYLAKLIDAARQDQDSAAAQEVVDPIQEQPQQQQEGPSQITLKSENDANLTMQMKGFAKDGMNRTVTIRHHVGSNARTEETSGKRHHFPHSTARSHPNGQRFRHRMHP